MNKVFLFVGALLFIAILGASGYFFFTQNKKYINPQSDRQTQILPAENTNFEDTQTQTAGFTDPQGTFSFTYTTDYTLDIQNDGKYIRLSKIGQTQRGQTELYDGVNIVFESIDLRGTSLFQWVNMSIKEKTADGSVEITENPKPITQNGYSGLTYAVRGLGTSQYLLFQKDSSSSFAVSITKRVEDPRQMGYQTEVEAILETMELLK